MYLCILELIKLNLELWLTKLIPEYVQLVEAAWENAR